MAARAWLVAALLAVPAGNAAAHALLDHATPAVGATIAEAPRQVTLAFTEQVEPAFSQVRVENAAGQSVTAGPAAPVPGHEDQLAVQLKPIGSGRYQVTWKVVSVDTHVTQGSFSFTVGGGG